MSGEAWQFWGLVIVVSVLALGFLVAPLVRRRSGLTAVREVYDINVYKDQLVEIERDVDRGLLNDAQAEAARIEIKRRLLATAEQAENATKNRDTDTSATGLASNLGLISVIVLALPAAAVSLYLNLGRPGQPDQPFAERPARTQVANAANKSEMRSITEQLAKRLESNPDDLRGWMLLGRSYLSMRQFDDAAGAYGKAYGLSGEDNEVGAEYAEALSLTGGAGIPPLARDIFNQSLAANPLNAKARFYVAMAKAQDGDTRGAVQGWVDLVAISAADAPWLSILKQHIDKGAADLGIDPGSVQPSPEMATLAAEARRQRAELAPAPKPAAEAPGPTREDVEAAGDMTADDRMSMIRSMVNRLAERLKDNPNDKAGWQRLERAYRVLGETAKADEAAANLAKLP